MWMDGIFDGCEVVCNYDVISEQIHMMKKASKEWSR